LNIVNPITIPIFQPKFQSLFCFLFFLPFLYLAKIYNLYKKYQHFIANLLKYIFLNMIEFSEN